MQQFIGVDSEEGARDKSPSVFRTCRTFCPPDKNMKVAEDFLDINKEVYTIN